MSFSIRVHSIKCLEESNELSTADEPYILVTTADMTPAIPGFPSPPIQPPITRAYGEWPHFDKDQIVDLIGERPFWNAYAEPWDAANLGQPNSFCFIVSVMEQDEGNIDRYRQAIEGLVLTTLGSTVMLPVEVRIERLVAAVRNSIGFFDFPLLDNHVATQQLRLDETDLAIPAGTHKDKKLIFDGTDNNNGKYELIFRIVHHERRTFEGSKLAAVSRQSDMMEVWAVGQNGLVHGNRYFQRWNGWYEIPGTTFGAGAYLAAVTRHNDHMEVWGVGPDGVVRGAWYNGDWQPWYEMPGALFPPGAPLAAVCRYESYMDLWGVDVNGQLRHKYFNNGWKPEGEWDTVIGATFAAGAHVAALARSPTDIQVWVAGRFGDDSPIYTNRWVPDHWSEWKPLGDEWFSAGTQLAAVASRQSVNPLPWPYPGNILADELNERPPSDVHLMAVDLQGHMREFWYEGEVERGWYQGGIETFNQGTPIAAGSREFGSVDVWAARDNSVLHYNRQNVPTGGAGWSGWVAMDATIVAQPAHLAAVSCFDGHMEVWAIRDEFVCGRRFENSAWGGWYQLTWSFVA